MARQHTVVRTANFIRILLDGKAIGIMQNCRCNDDYGMEPVSGIGKINAYEHVPTQARHQLNTTFAVMRRELLVQSGFIPENGEAALRGIVFDVEMYDKRDGQLIKKYISCSYNNGDFSVDAHRVIMRNASFLALDTAGLM